MVLADTGTLATLPPRELRAGYAEIAKAGLIGDAAFFAWCEANGAAVVGGDREAQAEAIMRACAFKAAVVGDDEREEKPNDGRALLNLGPHVRPRAGGGVRLQRRPAARRGRRGGAGPGVPAVGAARALRARRTRTAWCRTSRRWACRRSCAC